MRKVGFPKKNVLGTLEIGHGLVGNTYAIARYAAVLLTMHGIQKTAVAYMQAKPLATPI